MKNLFLFKSLTKYCISQYSQFTPEAARPIDRTCCSVSRDAGVVLKTRQSLKRQKPGLDKTILLFLDAHGQSIVSNTIKNLKQYKFGNKK